MHLNSWGCCWDNLVPQNHKKNKLYFQEQWVDFVRIETGSWLEIKLTLNNWLYGINHVLCCVCTRLYMFLKKITQHVDNRTCFCMLSRCSCCACVCRDDMAIPVCQSVRCSWHSSHSVYFVHGKKSANYVCFFWCVLSLFFITLFCFSLVFVSFLLTCSWFVFNEHYKLFVA